MCAAINRLADLCYTRPTHNSATRIRQLRGSHLTARLLQSVAVTASRTFKMMMSSSGLQSGACSATALRTGRAPQTMACAITVPPAVPSAAIASDMCGMLWKRGALHARPRPPSRGCALHLPSPLACMALNAQGAWHGTGATHAPAVCAARLRQPPRRQRRQPQQQRIAGSPAMWCPWPSRRRQLPAHQGAAHAAAGAAACSCPSRVAPAVRSNPAHALMLLHDMQNPPRAWQSSCTGASTDTTVQTPRPRRPCPPTTRPPG